MIKELGYLRVAAARPLTKPVNVKENTKNLISLMEESSVNKCDISVYPELSISSYNCGELFRQQLLLDSALEALILITQRSSELFGIHIVGFPFAEKGQLFNCAVAVSRGSILGIVPKTFIPNNNEYYEGRWFSTGFKSSFKSIFIDGKEMGCVFVQELARDGCQEDMFEML